MMLEDLDGWLDGWMDGGQILVFDTPFLMDE